MIIGRCLLRGIYNSVQIEGATAYIFSQMWSFYLQTGHSLLGNSLLLMGTYRNLTMLQNKLTFSFRVELFNFFFVTWLRPWIGEGKWKRNFKLQINNKRITQIATEWAFLVLPSGNKELKTEVPNQPGTENKMAKEQRNAKPHSGPHGSGSCILPCYYI